jgi:hypothetical protein
MWLQIKSFFIVAKNTIIVIGICILLGLTIYSIVVTKQLKTEKINSVRVENNFQNSQFKIDSLKTKNGQLEYSVNVLTVKQTEFEKFAPDLNKQLTDMGLKVQNLESVVKANIRYVYLPGDSIPFEVEKQSENVFTGKYSDNLLKISERVTLINNKTSIKIDSLNLALTDSLLMPNEIIYKRSWIFWKKAVGMKVWIKSANPHFKIDQMQTYSFVK